MKETIIEYKGAELVVKFDYTPEEPMVMYYKDGSGHPGSPAEVHIDSIKIDRQEVYELIEDQIEDIEELILKNYEQEEEN